jgi:hypothetical protein
MTEPTTLSQCDLTKDERKAGRRIPDHPTATPKEGDERVQVGLSKYLVEKLIKGWLEDGAGPGTIKEVCERSVRLWLTIFANLAKQGDAIQLKESRTGAELREFADRLNRYFSDPPKVSRSTKESYLARIGTHIAVSMLAADILEDSDNNLFHEVLLAAERNKLRIGEEVVRLLRLARDVLAAPSATTAGELRKPYLHNR